MSVGLLTFYFWGSKLVTFVQVILKKSLSLEKFLLTEGRDNFGNNIHFFQTFIEIYEILELIEHTWNTFVFKQSFDLIRVDTQRYVIDV